MKTRLSVGKKVESKILGSIKDVIFLSLFWEVHTICLRGHFISLHEKNQINQENIKKQGTHFSSIFLGNLNKTYTMTRVTD